MSKQDGLTPVYFSALRIPCSEVIAVRNRRGGRWTPPTDQRNVLTLLSVFFLAGGAGGCLFAGLAQSEEIDAYLTAYLELARQGTVVREFWPILWGQLRPLLLTLLLGLTAVGVVGIPLLFLVRGFLLGFSVRCFCGVFGPAGAIPALALFGLPALLWGPALFLAGVPGWSGARARMTPGGERRLAVDWSRTGLCLLLGLGGVGVEYGLTPRLLGAAVRVLL